MANFVQDPPLHIPPLSGEPRTFDAQWLEWFRSLGRTSASAGNVSSVSGVTANGFSVTITNPATTPAITIGTTFTGIAAAAGGQLVAATSTAASTLVGRRSGSSGVLDEITLGSGVSMTGTTLNASGSGGTVTTVSVTSTHGFAGLVSNPTTAPAIALSITFSGLAKGDGTSLSAAVAGSDYSAGTSGLGTGILKTTTGTGALSIAAAGDFPTLNQNTTGTATNVTGIVLGVNGGTGVNNSGKTITLGGNLTTSGAFASTFTMTGVTTVTFPTSGTLATVSGALGTPTSITLTNGTGLPISTGVSGLGAGVATFLTTPTSTNLAAALTDELGTGSAMFGTEGTFTPGLTFGGAAVGMAFTSSGTHSKIGNRYFYEGILTLSNKGSSTGAALITGLPAASTSNSTASIRVTNIVAGVADHFLAAIVVSGTSTLRIDKYATSATTLTQLADTDFSATTTIWFAGSFKA